MSIKVSTSDVIKYCSRENKMQKRVYPNRITMNKMTKSQANQYYKIIKDVKEIAEMAELKGISWSDIKKIIEEKEDNQKRLFE